MLSRKSLIVYAMAFAMVVLFAAGEVMAFSNEPCSQVNYTHCDEPAMTDSVGTWSITLIDIKPVGTDGQYEWHYKIQSNPDGSFVGSNFVGFLLPDCCNTDEKIEIDETGSNPDLSCEEVGDGEPTIYFGRYNNQAFVCKGNPDNTGDWIILANTQYKTTSTIIIKNGKDVLQFEMAVPGCPLAPAPTEPLIGSRTFSECSNFGQDTIEPFMVLVDGVAKVFPATADDISFYVIRTDDRDGCVARIYRCLGHGCTDSCEEVDPAALPSNTVLETSFIRTCPDENISVTHGSPFYLYSVKSGGVTFNSCLDLGTYTWTTMNNCQ